MRTLLKYITGTLMGIALLMASIHYGIGATFIFAVYVTCIVAIIRAVYSLLTFRLGVWREDED